MSSNKGVQIIDGEGNDFKASVHQKTSSNPLVVEIVDASGDQITDFTGTASNVTDIKDGTVTITTKGTAVQLSVASVACKRVFVSAHEENSGTVLVGSSTVVANLSGRRGMPLFSTQGDWINIPNLNLIWVDSTEDNDKITFLYEI